MYIRSKLKVIVYLGLFLFLFKVAVEGTIYYSKYSDICNYTPKGEYVTVKSVITDCTEFRFWGSSYHDKYVTYQYNGVEYKDVYYITESYVYPTTGNHREVQIDSGNPAKIKHPDMEDTIWDFSFAMKFCFLISNFVLLNLLSSALTEDSWREIYKDRCISSDIVRKELDFELDNKLKYKLILRIIMSAILLLSAIVNLSETMLGCCFTIIMIIWVFHFLEMFFKAGVQDSRAVVVFKDTLIEKYTDRNVEGPDIDYLVLSTQGRVAVNRTRYMSYTNPYRRFTEDTNYYVAVDKENRMLTKIRIFNADEFVFIED